MLEFQLADHPIKRLSRCGDAARHGTSLLQVGVAALLSMNKAREDFCPRGLFYLVNRTTCLLIGLFGSSLCQFVEFVWEFLWITCHVECIAQATCVCHGFHIAPFRHLKPFALLGKAFKGREGAWGLILQKRNGLLVSCPFCQCEICHLVVPIQPKSRGVP